MNDVKNYAIPFVNHLVIIIGSKFFTIRVFYDNTKEFVTKNEGNCNWSFSIIGFQICAAKITGDGLHQIAPRTIVYFDFYKITRAWGAIKNEACCVHHYWLGIFKGSASRISSSNIPLNNSNNGLLCLYIISFGRSSDGIFIK